MPVHSRVALITGAGSGLGAALVRGLVAAGWRVAAAGHRVPPAEAGGDGNGEVLACALDVTRREESVSVVASLLERWGRLDLLVNNAGVTMDRLLAGMRESEWDAVIDVHLKGAFFCAQAVLPAMIRQGDGQILNVGSFSAKRGSVGQVNYAAAKAGMMGLTLSLAREVAEHGVRVNGVLPGVLPTKMTAALSESARDSLVRANLFKRMNSLEEVVSLVVGLAETRNVSGQVFQWDSRIGRWA
jgi:3-oxoacyl-[acyl-carrier protein] reductase